MEKRKIEFPLEMQGGLIVPRNPDPNTKNQQAYVRGNTEEEKELIKAAKQICARNKDLNMRDVLMKGIKKFLRDHNWPPGNSQTMLASFDVKPVLPQLMCGISGCNRRVEYKNFREHEVVYRCGKHKHWQLPWHDHYGSEKIKKRLRV